MTRIVAGIAGGRRIAAPPGSLTRPTSDRAREALFSAVETLLTVKGARVLDLYAGSGAVGLEALSRGAEHALFVEADSRAARVLRANVASLGLSGAVVRTERVERLVSDPAGAPYDFVFADPPYQLDADMLRHILAELEANGWLSADAIVVVERSSRDADWVWPKPLIGLQVRRYGDAALWYGRRS